MKTINIATSRPYDVVVESGSLSRVGEIMAERFEPPCKICVVTDSNVGRLYGDQVADSLRDAGYETFRISFPSGEHSKSLSTYMNLLESMAEEGMTRGDILLSLGGGVVGDITGFAASTYMRGIKYVNVPTSFLADIDSSVGGKTGVNLLAGKNLAGSLWQPSLVVIDPEALKTLPEDRMKDGIAEALKSAVILDNGLINHLQEKNYEYVIERCISIKKSLVEADEMDTGLRQLLNFGHTLAHGIEKMSSYAISHGLAVAKGMVGESRATYAMGFTKSDISDELRRLIEGFGMDPSLPYDAEELYRHALMDKKIRGGEINIIVPELIGRCSLRKISLDELKTLVEKSVDS